MRYGLHTREQLALEMAAYVEDHMEGFKSDFYEHDVQTLADMDAGDERYWIVRELGTWFPVADLNDDTTISILESSKDNAVAAFRVTCWHSTANGNARFTIDESEILENI